MRISIFANEIPSSAFVENMVKGLAERGYDIYIYGKYISDPRYQAYPNIHFVKKPQTFWGNIVYATCYVLKLLFTKPRLLVHLIKITKLKSLTRWIKKFNMYATLYSWNVDIIHIQWAKSVVILGKLIKDGNIKVVLSLRGTHINVSPIIDEKYKNEFEELFPLIHGFHSVSNALIQESKKYFHALPQKSVVAYPAVANDTLKLFKSSFVKGPKFNIISVGRFNSIKGFIYALDAIKLMVDNGIPVYYTIIAVGTLPDQLLFQIEDLDLHDFVCIKQSQPHPDVLQSIMASDVLLLSSLEEGIPNVIIEAMALGTPVVSTNFSGVSEVVCDGVNGFVAEICSPDSIAACLTKVYQLLPEEREQMLQRANSQIYKNHRQDMQLNNIESLYNSVVHNWR